MIALIRFDDNLVIERDEAERLKLNYEEKERFGISMSYGRKLEPMNGSAHYEDELFKKELEDNKVKYYLSEDCEKEISEYNRYKRPPEGDLVYVESGNHLVDLNTFVINCRFPFRIEKALQPEVPTIENLNSMLAQIEQKFVSINKAMDNFKNQQFNEKVNVHVGGGLIVTYNELKLLEDSCTDILQSSLNEGWRVIAVCVQPNQRRPDYVLGRYNSDLDVHENALRR